MTLNRCKIIDNRLQSIPIQRLQELLDAIYQDGRYTPLILDESGRANTYFTYATNCTLISMKGFMVRVDVQHTQTLPEAQEDLRQSLVSALKHGKRLVLALEDCALDIRGRYAEKTHFPIDCLAEGGRRFQRDATLYDPCVRRPQDLEPYGVFVAREEFRLLLTSQFGVDEYQEYLWECLPHLDAWYLPIHIQS
jgi:hypothetical protein